MQYVFGVLLLGNRIGTSSEQQYVYGVLTTGSEESNKSAVSSVMIQFDKFVRDVVREVHLGNATQPSPHRAVSTGWYLMVPPLARDYWPKLAPLSRWGTEESFDTAAECREYESYLLKTTKDFEPVFTRGKIRTSKEFAKIETDNQLRFAALFGKCIATDDPRLTQTK